MSTRIVAYTSDVIDGQVLLRNSEEDELYSLNPVEMLDFIGENYSDPEVPYRELKVTWDLDVFLSVILRVLGLRICKELASKKHECLFRFTESGLEVYDPKTKPDKFPAGLYHIFYIPGKVFSLQTSTHKSYIYHLAQYYDNDEPTTEPMEIHAKASILIDAFQQMGLNPFKLTSPISVYESSVLNHMDVPSILDLPKTLKETEADEIIQWAEHCTNRDWLEAFQIGHWESGESWDYDLQCYSDDTECLTITGWKLIKDLRLNELILGFNPNTEKCSFQPVLKLHNSFYEGEMYSIEKEKASLCVTPNHRMLLQDHIRSKQSKYYKRYGKLGFTDWLVYEAQSMPNGNCRIPVSYQMEDRPDYPIKDDMLRLIAWINTEGHSVKDNGLPNGIVVSQEQEANIEYSKEIQIALNSLNLFYTKHTNRCFYKHTDKNGRYKDYYYHYDRYRICFNSFRQIPLEDNIHHMPLWILKSCSLRQLKIYFDTLIKGDGSQSTKNGIISKTTFYTNLKVNADRMMYLCHLLGYNCHANLPDKHHTTYQLYIVEDGRKCNHRQTLQHGDVHKIYYRGFVVCPSIKDGFFITRRNFKSCICGNSAFGYALSTLKNFRYAEFIKMGVMVGNADDGLLKGQVTIYDHVKASPIVYYQDGRTFNPAGCTWNDILPLDDVKFIHQWGIGEFKLDCGWFWTYKAPVKPFEVPLNRVFNLRNKQGMVKKLAKRIGAAVWAKLIQQNTDGNINKHYNPIMAMQTVTKSRLRVAQFIYEHNLQDYLIHIGIDGVRSSKRAPLKEIVKMGEWKLNEPTPVIVLSPGRVFTSEKKPQGLYYQDLAEMITAHPYETYYSKKLRRRQTLSESVAQGDLKGLGIVKDFDSSIDLSLARTTQDRIFPKFPKNGHELMTQKFESYPSKI